MSTILQAYLPPLPQKALFNTNVVRIPATKAHGNHPNYRSRRPEIAGVLGIIRLPLKATLVSPVSTPTPPQMFKNRTQLARDPDNRCRVSSMHAKNVGGRKRSVTRKNHAKRVRTKICVAMGGQLQQSVPKRRLRTTAQSYKRSGNLCGGSLIVQETECKTKTVERTDKVPGTQLCGQSLRNHRCSHYHRAKMRIVQGRSIRLTRGKAYRCCCERPTLSSSLPTSWKPRNGLACVCVLKNKK